MSRRENYLDKEWNRPRLLIMYFLFLDYQLINPDPTSRFLMAEAASA
jgi:hypothetical protein